MTITGQPWQATNTTSSLLPTMGNDPFWYAHHPSSWHLMTIGTGKKKRHVFVPSLASIQIKAGVNGVRGQSPNLDTSLLRASMTNDGWQILDPQRHDYMRVYPCRNGKLHVDKNIGIEVLAGRVIMDKSSVAEALDEWCLELIRQGQINPPHEHFLKLIIQTQRKTIPRHLQNQHIPEVMEKLKAHKAKLAAMEKALADYKKNGLAVYDLGGSDE